MDTKLTLRLNKDIIEKAKVYARKRGQSLSGLVENYFRFIVYEKEPEELYTPLVRELSGIIELPAGYDLKEKYTDYLIEKYE